MHETVHELYRKRLNGVILKIDFEKAYDKVKYPIIFSRRHLRPPPSPTVVREGSAALPSTLPERGIDTGGIYIAMPASEVMRE